MKARAPPSGCSPLCYLGKPGRGGGAVRDGPREHPHGVQLPLAHPVGSNLSKKVKCPLQAGGGWVCGKVRGWSLDTPGISQPILGQTLMGTPSARRPGLTPEVLSPLPRVGFKATWQNKTDPRAWCVPSWGLRGRKGKYNTSYKTITMTEATVNYLTPGGLGASKETQQLYVCKCSKIFLKVMDFFLKH